MGWQQMPGGIIIPEPPDAFYTTGPAFSTVGMSVSTHRYGAVFQASKTCNIGYVNFRTGTVNVGTTLDVRLETVNASGEPSGSLFGTNTNVSKGIANGDDNVWINCTLTAPAAVTIGDRIALSINNSGSGDLAISTSADWTNSYSTYTLKYNGTTWAKQTAQIPIFSLYDDVGLPIYTESCVPYFTLTHTAFSSSSTPDERGLKFKFPFPVKIRGAWFYIDPDADFRIKVYDSDGSTVLVNTLIDCDMTVSKAERYFVYMFPSIVTCLKDTYYRCTVVPDTTTSIDFAGFTVASASEMESARGGQNLHLTTRTDAGAWTDTTNARPYMGLILDSFDDGVGQIVIPRKGSVLMKM